MGTKKVVKVVVEVVGEDQKGCVLLWKENSDVKEVGCIWKQESTGVRMLMLMLSDAERWLWCW